MLRRCGVSSTSLNEDSDSDESWPERFNVGSYNTVSIIGSYVQWTAAYRRSAWLKQIDINNCDNLTTFLVHCTLTLTHID